VTLHICFALFECNLINVCNYNFYAIIDSTATCLCYCWSIRKKYPKTDDKHNNDTLWQCKLQTTDAKHVFTKCSHNISKERCIISSRYTTVLCSLWTIVASYADISFLIGGRSAPCVQSIGNIVIVCHLYRSVKNIDK